MVYRVCQDELWSVRWCDHHQLTPVHLNDLFCRIPDISWFLSAVQVLNQALNDVKKVHQVATNTKPHSACDHGSSILRFHQLHRCGRTDERQLHGVCETFVDRASRWVPCMPISGN